MAHPKQILESLQANARKSLSQNFLTSPHWADLLVHRALEPKSAEEIWEIGPGLGALTKKLVAGTSKPIRVFEYDRKLAAYLRTEIPQVEVNEGDFLKFEISKISPEKRISVLSNLPYHLSSAILFRLLEEKHRIDRAVLTFQREFAERLIAGPRTPDYGALSVIMQLHYNIESVGVLPPGAFYPAPGVASEALVFEPKPHSTEFAGITSVVKSAFRHRRKKMASNLKQDFPNAPIVESLAQMGISTDARPEELSKDQYIKLSSLLKRTVSVLLLFLGLNATASQDQVYGLGGDSSGRVGSVTANETNPFAALQNPGLLSAAPEKTIFLSTGGATTNYTSFSNVNVDSSRFRTEHGENRREDFQIPSVSLGLWSLGLVYPFEFIDHPVGLGVTLSGPFDRLRSFHSVTPYDFSTLHYGTSDAQFKAATAVGLNLIEDHLDFGVGVTLFMTSSGVADTTLLSENPTGRMNMEIGMNSSPSAGLFARLTETSRASFVYRAQINPVFYQEMDGKFVLEGREVAHQPFSFSTSLYYEPASVEIDYQNTFGDFTFSAGISYQEWTAYVPASLRVDIAQPDGSRVTSDLPSLVLQNTFSPRVSLRYEILPERFQVSAGYRFRPTPLTDLSGPSNLVDADTHILGLNFQYRIQNVYLNLFGQYHHTPTRHVEKASPDYIGAPGYDFSANSYSYGLSLGTSL